MSASSLPPLAASLFSHVTAQKCASYRAIMEAFAAAKRQFRLHLRPDEVLLEALVSAPSGVALLKRLAGGDPRVAKSPLARSRQVLERAPERGMSLAQLAAGSMAEQALAIYEETVAELLLEDLRGGNR